MNDEEEELQRRTQLTEAEVSELREMLEEERRAKWLWSSIRVWAVWVAAVVGGTTIFWDSATRVLKAIVGK